MNELDPLTAAKLADAVYGIRTDENVKRGIASRGVKGLGESFDLAGATVAQGVTGMGAVSKQSGFALVLNGTGRRQGEVAVVTRGTATGHDWLSNINCAMTKGSTGHSVHAGFQKVLKSIESSINQALKGKNPSRIHCVGHSLGGAVANLTAVNLAGQGQGVSLYTFGAPRVGAQAAAQDVVDRVGLENIYRVYNPADVVPMVPIYPFMHAPASREGLCVRTGGGMFSLNAHYMSSYTPAVERATWRGLANASTGTPLHLSVDQWLDKAGESSRIPGAAIGVWALGHALKALLELAQAAGAVVYIAGATVADRIAAMLLRLANFGVEMASRVKRWIALVMRFVGKTASNTRDLTHSFLHWVLELIATPLLSLAGRAIEYGMRGY